MDSLLLSLILVLSIFIAMITKVLNKFNKKIIQLERLNSQTKQEVKE